LVANVYAKKEPVTITLLEFPDEVDAYLKEKNFESVNSRSSHVISLSLKTHAYLVRSGLAAEKTIPYFQNDSHALSLRKSHEISEWIWKRVQFQDNLGVSFAYEQSLAWYIRIVVHHFLWLLEIMHNAAARHDTKVIRACASSASLDVSGYMIGPRERYLATVAEAFCEASGLTFEPIETRSMYRFKKSRREVTRNIQRFLARRIAAPLVGPAYRSHLRRLGKRHPVLFAARDYRMADLAGSLARENGNLSMVLIREWGNLRGLVDLFRSNDGSPYNAEVWLGLLEVLAPGDEKSRHSLRGMIERLAAEIDGAGDVFSHRGVSFARLIKQKLEKGIGPFILGLQRRTATLYLLLETLQPSAVLSAGNRPDDVITGELCRGLGIPALLISHGSHVVPKTDLERIDWGEQGHRLLRAPYPFVALQSPLAEGFLKAFPSTSKGVRTGPVLWGSPVDRERSALLRGRTLNGDLSCRVIVHASTPKGRGVHRFHVYETPEEYVQSICDLVSAVKSLPNVHLVVKFRPSPEISVKDLQTLVPFFERTTLSVKESFLDVLGFADLLVSFSSTTIEEALQNYVPVLLYGCGGRYQHIPGVEVTPEVACAPTAVYVVERPEHLANGIERILGMHNTIPASGELFETYRYPENERVQVSALLGLKEAATKGVEGVRQ
jgi:hypothetical protein